MFFLTGAFSVVASASNAARQLPDEPPLCQGNPLLTTQGTLQKGVHIRL